MNNPIQRNTNLGRTAKTLGRMTYFPSDIQEASTDNNQSDMMVLVGPMAAAQYILGYGRKNSIMHPIKMNRFRMQRKDR